MGCVVKAVATIKEISSLAWPLVLMQLSSIALTTVDLIMMGMLGPLEIAAGGIAVALFGVLRTSCVGLLMPVSNLFAQTWAQRSGQTQALLNEQLGLSLMLATVAGALMAFLMILLFPLLRFLGQDPQLLALGQSFMLFLAPSLIPLLWLQVLRNAAVALKRPGPLLPVAFAGVALNAGLNYSLVFGVGMGLAGIGVATLLTQVAMTLGFYLLIRRDPLLATYLRLPPGMRDILRTERGRLFLRDTLKLGLPTAAAFASEAGFVAVLTLVAGTLGAASLAAHTLAFQFVNIAFMVSIGLSHATSILMSHALPQRDILRLRTLASSIIGMGFVAMGLVGMLYLTIPGVLIDLFLKRDTVNIETVRNIAVPLLALAALLQFADCQQNLAIGAMRGILKARDTFLLTLTGYWLVGVPAVLALCYGLDLGLSGVWLGFFVGLSTTSLLLWLRFYHYIRGMEKSGAGA